MSRKPTYTHALAASLLLGGALAVFSCGAPRKVSYLRENRIQASLTLAADAPLEDHTLGEVRAARRDTLVVHDYDGREMIIMRAIRDEEGEMVAHEVLDAAVVTARFRNVAERHGKVDIQFNITVPPTMQDKGWQLRFSPTMFILGDSLRLDSVIITGADYRKAQLKGYQQYERFLASIVADTTRFINLRQLEIFLKRNIPALYAFKTDSTEVSDEYFHSVFGVTEQEAVEHYTDKFARRINRWRRSRIGKMWKRYVKVPIVTEGIRLDTVLRAGGGEFVYCYTQTINTRPRLRQVDIVLDGEIYDGDRRIYTIPRSEPLSFYISSLSSFVDPTERYLTRVIERRVEANTACYVEFAQGRHEVDLSLGHNGEEIGRIRGNLSDLLRNDTFDLDSIVITASCSPEGSWKANSALSQRRSEAVSRYFRSWMRHCADSLMAEEGVQLIVGEDGREHFAAPSRSAAPEISFLPHCDPENWQRLDVLVAEDTVLTADEKAAYERIREEGDPDVRERRLSGEKSYRYLREELYPYLRTVRFDFHLHRKGMVKDTVHTTEPDTLYRRGVQAIRDRDYETAVAILRPYNDFNTAIAYCSLDYNASARAILEGLDRDAKVNYMLALLYSREGDDQRAVECFLHALAQEPSYRFRANLDPEISALVRRYGLQEKEDDPLDDSMF